jgi:hypothetical protein
MSPSTMKLVILLMFAAVPLTTICLAQDKVTTIKGQFTETNTMLECDCNPLVWTQNFVITISGKNHIHEEWSGHNNNNLVKTGQHDSDLGEARGSAVWHVVGPNKMEKVVTFKQHIQRLVVTTQRNNCSLDVVFSLKSGFSDMYAPRADNGEWTHFTLPRVIQTSCEIN